ncbi:triose-phosphate isomerase [Leuconostoc gelidum subsp. gelidum]|uniref:Triosephosphate isomerase n=1 Tax=Leuconostoc gelidum subsp. gelidum TaxID=1607839 RepID=A0AB35G1C6_LEUGE|nr:triose-phosphate isomerase [Leuconostoc gelidum]MBZ5964583.1 triose-phosphate isomerase [Leuconostoc gelidum subsp. gelidum]MBZ5974812.1 triose-phosphate isomerase [Leuconostoc gelidum subsp. gelidum]MBZ5977652.1 triose-phosphate isomerase [Leuconostoc gelidum subsp. gelidum]MBZ5986410.1 triose-phosphate isomerase [Leuconostoc gelidum subsp. gelidum]MBZ5999363.1 triose-phosphate isomerase [Leuconostoc gelidum subsp. gelidum]
MICIVNFKNMMHYEKQLKWLQDIEREFLDFKLLVAPTLPEHNSYHNYEIIAQNISLVQRTVGEVSASVLNGLKIQYAFVGHLERRRLLNETTDLINERLINCLDNHIVPIICLGIHSGPDLVIRELKSILKNSDLSDQRVIIAYESLKSTQSNQPVYSYVEMEAVYLKLKQYMDELTNSSGLSSYHLVMGGHINEEGINVAEKIGYDGVLIGDRYQEVTSFQPLIKTLNRIKRERLLTHGS